MNYAFSMDLFDNLDQFDAQKKTRLQVELTIALLKHLLERRTQQLQQHNTDRRPVYDRVIRSNKVEFGHVHLPPQLKYQFGLPTKHVKFLLPLPLDFRRHGLATIDFKYFPDLPEGSFTDL